MTSSAPKRRPKPVWAVRYLSAAITESQVTSLLRTATRHRPEPCRNPLLTSAGSSTTFRTVKLGHGCTEAAAGASKALIHSETLPHATPRASKCSNHLTRPVPARTGCPVPFQCSTFVTARLHQLAAFLTLSFELCFNGVFSYSLFSKCPYSMIRMTARQGAHRHVRCLSMNNEERKLFEPNLMHHLWTGESPEKAPSQLCNMLWIWNHRTTSENHLIAWI